MAVTFLCPFSCYYPEPGVGHGQLCCTGSRTKLTLQEPQEGISVLLRSGWKPDPSSQGPGLLINDRHFLDIVYLQPVSTRCPS